MRGVNFLAQSYLAMGAKVCITGVGRSYLNPFTMVTDIDDDTEMLKPLFAQMISPSRALSDYEMSQLEINLRDLWASEGRNSTVAGIVLTKGVSIERR